MSFRASRTRSSSRVPTFGMGGYETTGAPGDWWDPRTYVTDWDPTHSPTFKAAVDGATKTMTPTPAAPPVVGPATAPTAPLSTAPTPLSTAPTPSGFNLSSPVVIGGAALLLLLFLKKR